MFVPSVHCSPSPSGTSVAVIVPPLPPAPGTAERVAAIGLPAVRARALAAARAEPAVSKWLTLAEQVRATERAVADADAVVRRVGAAKVLLEENPEGDFAAKLRAVAAELAGALDRRAAAVADLDTLRGAAARLP